MSATLPADLQYVMLDEATIQARVRELGVRITRDFAGEDLRLVTVLKGGLSFSPICAGRSTCLSPSTSWPFRRTRRESAVRSA